MGWGLSFGLLDGEGKGPVAWAAARTATTPTPAFHMTACPRASASCAPVATRPTHAYPQPTLELYRRLALLTRGNMIYFGEADKALAMFEKAGLPCPAGRSATDHFLHVVNQVCERVMCDACSEQRVEEGRLGVDGAWAGPPGMLCV